MTRSITADPTRRGISARRQQLAEQFFTEMGAMKRRLFEEMGPTELGDGIAGVTIHQLEAVLCLMSSEAGITMNDLARAQGVGLSSCTALADRLLRHGLAERNSDPEDRRVVRLTATARARAIVDQFRQRRRTRLLELFAPLDDSEIETLIRLMHTMASAPAPAAAPS